MHEPCTLLLSLTSRRRLSFLTSKVPAALYRIAPAFQQEFQKLMLEETSQLATVIACASDCGCRRMPLEGLLDLWCAHRA
jgi:hypothetical protein